MAVLVTRLDALMHHKCGLDNVGLLFQRPEYLQNGICKDWAFILTTGCSLYVPWGYVAIPVATPFPGAQAEQPASFLEHYTLDLDLAKKLTEPERGEIASWVQKSMTRETPLAKAFGRPVLAFTSGFSPLVRAELPPEKEASADDDGDEREAPAHKKPRRNTS